MIQRSWRVFVVRSCGSTTARFARPDHSKKFTQSTWLQWVNEVNSSPARFLPQARIEWRLWFIARKKVWSRWIFLRGVSQSRQTEGRVTSTKPVCSFLDAAGSLFIGPIAVGDSWDELRCSEWL